MTLLVAVAFSAIASPVGQLLPQTGPPSAVLWKDQLLCSSPGGATRYLGALYRGSFDARLKRIRDPIRYETWAQYYGVTLAKLEIVGDRILFHTTDADHYIAPITALPLIEDSTFGKYLDQEAERILKLAGKENCFPYHGINDLLLDPVHRAADYTPPPLPIDHRNGVFHSDWYKVETRQVVAMQEYIREARFSLQIAGPNTVRLFHAVAGKLFVSVEPDYIGLPIPTPEEKVPKAPDRELRVGKLPAGFDGHFAAYRVGEKEYTDYLVTRAGKVFACRPKGEAELSIEPVWDNPKRKVYGVLRDTDGAVYGFGYVGVTTNPARFVVKFEAKPVAKAYTMTAPLHFEPEDTYREAYECARAVAKAKK